MMISKIRFLLMLGTHVSCMDFAQQLTLQTSHPFTMNYIMNKI